MECTILDTLRGINAYPVPAYAIAGILAKRGIDPSSTATVEILNGKSYRLSKADILLWLSLAPNVTQGGQSYSFTDEQRTRMRNEAKAILAEFGEDSTTTGVKYGYKGSRL